MSGIFTLGAVLAHKHGTQPTMNRLDTFLKRLGDLLDAQVLDGFGDAIRRLVAEDKADEWRRQAAAAMERRARLNGPHREWH